MIYRCIAPAWLLEKDPTARRVWEGEFDDARVQSLNEQGYNIYFLPNYPSVYTPGTPVSGSHIDTFEYVYVDMDLKDGAWKCKEDFIDAVKENLPPTFIVDSGNGVHVYWRVSDLDGMSCLRLCRRLMRHFSTDVAVGQIYQLMRVPRTVNTKKEEDFKLCSSVYQSEITYTCEQLDAALPPITYADEAYCVQHFNKTYQINQEELNVDEQVPEKFLMLLAKSAEIRDIWEGKIDDRSAGDFRLGHLMYGDGFTKDEALSVLVNVEKAKARAPQHRIAYAANIVDKIWVFEEGAKESLSSSVKDILAKGGKNLKGVRFHCHRLIDATHHGFRLGQVIGLVAGAGVGKTAMALNMFKWFVELNPDDYVHFFVPLEQPANEIADRWKTMCGDNTKLHEKVHVISNYAEDGSFRHLSLDEIKDYLLQFQKDTGKKAGCVVIDHIGVLKKKGKDGENQDLMTICHAMKAFAVQTNTLLVMQSQTSREKAGVGDLELDKDAAYGTMYFEAYCDYLLTIWQPLKRCYENKDCPTITAFKFCKIRHKKKHLDEAQEDVRYLLAFDPETETMGAPTQEQLDKFKYFYGQSLVKRKADKKTDAVPYKSTPWFTGGDSGDTKNSSDSKGA